VSLDQIALRGLRVHGHHGVFGHERRDGQEFIIDAVLWTDTRAAAETDDLSRTVDYGGLADRLSAIASGEPVSLAVEEVEITVHKPHAPVPHPFDDVTVTIRRTRQ
jgi:dihydroneopterin aldolase